MAYEIGVATSPSDILDKIKVVAIARGWTIHNDSNPSASTRWLSVQIGDAYFNLLSSTALGMYIYGCQATGFNVANDWENQPGTSRDPNYTHGHCRANELVGPYTSYRIFSGATYIHVVIETLPGVFSHIAIGVLNKYGTYTGGGYMSMSNWHTSEYSTNYPEGTHIYLFDWNTGDNSSTYNPTILRADIDGKNFFYRSFGTPAGNIVTGLIREGSSGIVPLERQNLVMFKRTPNAFNLVTPLLPSVLHVYRGSGLYSPAGDVPDFRVVNMTRFNSGDELTLGADTWVLIAAKSKTTLKNVYGSTIPSSGDYGYAFKKVI